MIGFGSLAIPRLSSCIRKRRHLVVEGFWETKRNKRVTTAAVANSHQVTNRYQVQELSKDKLVKKPSGVTRLARRTNQRDIQW